MTPKDGTKELRIAWTSDIDGPLGTGSQAGYRFVTPGARLITVTARDRFGATARQSVQYTVTNALPSVTIFSPGPNTTLFRGVPVILSGAGKTPVLFALPCDRLRWTVDVLPSWSAPGGRGADRNPSAT